MEKADRVLQYCKLPPEGRKVTETPAECWPQQGRIHCNDVSYSYAKDEPMVLKNLTVEMKPREKVKQMV